MNWLIYFFNIRNMQLLLLITAKFINKFSLLNITTDLLYKYILDNIFNSIKSKLFIKKEINVINNLDINEKLEIDKDKNNVELYNLILDQILNESIIIEDNSIEDSTESEQNNSESEQNNSESKQNKNEEWIVIKKNN